MDEEFVEVVPSRFRRLLRILLRTFARAGVFRHVKLRESAREALRQIRANR